jgi:hypothetical protein
MSERSKWRERIVFSTHGAGTFGNTHAKGWLWTLSSFHAQKLIKSGLQT